MIVHVLGFGTLHDQHENELYKAEFVFLIRFPSIMGEDHIYPVHL